MKLTCKQCGKPFELSDAELDFYKSKGLSVPKRCKDCRGADNSDSAAARKKRPLWLSIVILVLLITAFVIFADFGGESDGGSPADTGVSSAAGVTLDENEPAQSTPAEESREANAPPQEPADTAEKTAEANEPQAVSYTFRKPEYLTEHFEKHGGEFDYASEEEYLAGANRVINDPAALTKTEKEDGDFVYYLEASNEFVILSTDGYIRTYFRPSAGLDYFNRQ